MPTKKEPDSAASDTDDAVAAPATHEAKHAAANDTNDPAAAARGTHKARHDENNDVDDTTAAEAALKTRLTRKRTKTGCGTCRKRRVKCGEEKPVCRNCLKSRRVCEGYASNARFRHDQGSAGPQFGTVPTVYYHHCNAVSPDFQPQQYTQRGLNVPLVQHAIHFMPINNMHQHTYYQHTQYSYGHNSGGLQHVASASTYTVQQMPQPPAIPIHGQPLNGYMTPPPAVMPQWNGALQGPTFPMSASSHLWPEHSDGYQSDARSSPLSDRSGATPLGRIWDEYAQSAHVPDTQLLDAAAVQEHDDDYWDVESSDDESNMSYTTLSQASMNGTLVATPHQRLVHALHRLMLHTAPNNVLDAYRPERVANPLRNPATASVFLHWITSTAPGLQAVFERDPRNIISVFSAGEVPLNKRGIWTYAMPVAAMHDQGLLHAILAIASMEIAHFQDGSLTASLKHYAWSLKRVHQAVSNRKRRLRSTTIAASLLLAHYEMFTAEHGKWAVHLLGAKQLFQELDFSSMMQRFVVMKKERELRRRHEEIFSAMPQSSGRQQDRQLDQIPMIDEAIVSRFYGEEVRYGQLGSIEAERIEFDSTLDLHELEAYRDLFWWFCKQDVYLSLVAGTPLLMDWSRWSACPPRAPIGRSDAVFGTSDHIILLLGRITRYTAEDRKRKLKVMKQNGGQWTPHPKSKMAQAPPPPPPPPGFQPPPGPMFMGWAPEPPKADMPASYRSLDDEPIIDNDDGVWTMAYALKEYDDIQSALHEFRSRLGPDFEPLPSNFATSFGPVLVYSSLEIACVMALWNLAMILSIRAHPYYHPAAHAAAAMAVQETYTYAIDIGRIAAGIPLPDPSDTRPLNPYLSSALIESTMPSMFAATVYVSAAQRHETTARIYNIARRTGWRTADVIANGIETAWMLSASAGRGPPYTKIVEAEIMATLQAHSSGRPLDETPETQNSVQARLYRACGLLGTENDV